MRLCFWSAALWCCGVLSVAQAQPEASAHSAETSRDAEARALFEAGEVAYSSGHYEDALQYFRRSYELSGRDMLLFNIGAAAERLRRDGEALEAYSQYLDAVPNAANRGEVEARQRILEAAISRDARDTDERPSTPNENPEDGQGTRVVTWISAGLSVAFAGLAVSAWVVGDRKFESLKEECSAGCTQERVDQSSVPRWDRLTNASIGLSIAAAASAVVFFFVETESAPVSVGISPSGVSLAGRF